MGGAESRASPTLLNAVKDFQDRRAWRRFEQKYRPMIAGWCRAAGMDEVEELTQKVLLKLAQRLSAFVSDPSRGFRAYLKTMVTNAVRDSLRRRARRAGDRGVGGSQVQQLLQEVESHDDSAEWLDQLEEDWDPQRRRALQAVAEVKARVDPRTWEVFWLTTIEGQKGADVAARLGMGVASVHQAKSRVARRLQEAGARLAGAGPPAQ
jgi:RNA polymerase sigma-70 factor (ECF subfamily)